MTEKNEEKIDFSIITEAPGDSASEEQLERLYQRYNFVKQFAANKDVLEISCGSGIGLGYLAQTAKTVAGGDIEEKNVIKAKKYYNNREKIKIEIMDAHKLPYSDNSFDLLINYEAIYYFNDPVKFISESARVLRKDGMLIIGTVNKDWEDFHPSPFTHKYFSVPELNSLLKNNFNSVEFYGGFKVEKGGIKNSIFSMIKRLAANMHLIPGSLKARAYLKRIFMGKLIPLPDEISENMTPYLAPISIEKDKINRDFKIIYVVAKNN